MAQKWRVYNRHPNGLTHREKFRDEVIEIRANAYVLMDYEDAVRFKGQFFPMKKNAQGAPDPEGFKVIELVPNGDVTADAVAAKEFICHFDGKKFPTQAQLDSYVKQNYADQTYSDPDLDEQTEKEATIKRGRGRPPKEATT
jgi:S1-C subfamily serine protease